MRRESAKHSPEELALIETQCGTIEAHSASQSKGHVGGKQIRGGCCSSVAEFSTGHQVTKRKSGKELKRALLGSAHTSKD